MPHRVLVIGASQWKYAPHYAHHFPAIKFDIISLSGMKANEVAGSMIEATREFRDVVLHLGTNNLIGGETPHQVLHYIEGLVEQIRLVNPRIRIHISSVLFRGLNRFLQQPKVMMEKIQEINCRTRHLNELLRKYSGREAGIFFFNNWPQFLLASDHPEEELLSRDGLHLTPKGICCLLGSVEKYVSGVIKKEELTLKHAPDISKPPTTDHPVPSPPIWPILMNSVPRRNQPPPTQCISLPEYSVVQWPPLQNSALACSTAVPPLPVWPSIKISMAPQSTSTYRTGQRQPLLTPSLPLPPKPSDLHSHVSPKPLLGQRQPLSTPSLPLPPKPSDLHSHVSPKPLRGQRQPLSTPSLPPKPSDLHSHISPKPLLGQRQPLSTPSLPLPPKPSDLHSHVSPKPLRGQRQPLSTPSLPPKPSDLHSHISPKPLLGQRQPLSTPPLPPKPSDLHSHVSPKPLRGQRQPLSTPSLPPKPSDLHSHISPKPLLGQRQPLSTPPLPPKPSDLHSHVSPKPLRGQRQPLSTPSLPPKPSDLHSHISPKPLLGQRQPLSTPSLPLPPKPSDLHSHVSPKPLLGQRQPLSTPSLPLPPKPSDLHSHVSPKPLLGQRQPLSTPCLPPKPSDLHSHVSPKPLRGQRQPLSTPSLPLPPKPSDLHSHVSPKPLRGQRQPPSSLPLLPSLSKSSACTSPISPITATKPFTLLDRPIPTYSAMSSSPMVDTTTSKNTNHCYNSLMSNQLYMATPEPHNDSLYFEPSVSPQNVFPSENNSSDSSLFSWQFVRKRHSYKAEKQEAPCSQIPLSNRFSVLNPSIRKLDCKVLPSSVMNPSPSSFSPSSRKPSMLSKSHGRHNSNFNTLTYQPHICRPVRRQRRKPSCDFFYSSFEAPMASKHPSPAPTLPCHVVAVCKSTSFIHQWALNNSTDGSYHHVNLHYSQVGGSPILYPRVCNRCNREYKSRSTFSDHLNRCENFKIKIEYPRPCENCNHQFASRSSYSRHIKNCDPGSNKGIKCMHSGCEIMFRTHSAMAAHLSCYHGDKISVEEHTFCDMNEFHFWKRDVCQQNNLSFVKHSGEHGNLDKKFSSYICKFDNHHRNDSAINKTSRKRTFGCMPDTNCIARMLVTQDQNNVNVKYYNCHNHSLEFKNVVHYRWDKITNSNINSFLGQEVPAHVIQESYQPSLSDIETLPPIKEHFISSKPINKMKYELHLKQRLSKDDAVAVSVLVKSKLFKNSILIYKPLGMSAEIGDIKIDSLPNSSNLFILGMQNDNQASEIISGCHRILCIDSTHGTNQYKFHLLNLVVPDEYGVGYPVAHFITNRLDEETLSVMLQSIKDKCPKIELNAVMTDGDEALSKALHNVFGTKIRHLLCLWHVKRNWKKNLSNKLKDNHSLANEIYQNLEMLIEEKDQKSFFLMMESFMKKYADSASSFIEYFRVHYYNKCNKWAMCFRNFPHANTNTNMFVETFHNKLKTHYLNRKVNRRLDDLVTIIFRMQKTAYLSLKYKRMIEEPPLGFSNVNCLRHYKGIKIPDDNVIVVTKGNCWNVRAQSDPSSLYIVKLVNGDCSLPELCFIKCSELSCAGLCSHMYICSCSDKHSICKHVHKVHSFQVRNHRTSCAPAFEVESTAKLNLSSSISNNDKSKEQLIHSIDKSLKQIKSFIEQKKSEPLLLHVHNTLKLLVEKCDAIEHTTEPPNLQHAPVPPNSKLTPQYRLHQTSKDRKPTKHYFQRPSREQLESIKDSLMNSGSCSFTDPISSDSNLQETVCSIGQYAVNSVHLKSLDCFISDLEVEQLACVSPDFQRGWLYDTVIAAFLTIVSSSTSTARIIDPAVSQFVVSNMKLEKVLSIFQKISFTDVTKLIIPFNPLNSHWLLLVVRLNEKEIDFYDPSSDSIKPLYEYSIARWVTFLAHKCGGKIADWKTFHPKHPLQIDGHNCGVYISRFAEQDLKGQPVDHPFDPVAYRKLMFDTITGRSH